MDGTDSERALNAVDDVVHQSWAELRAEGLSCAEDGVADGDARGLFVDLDGGLVCVDANNLYSRVE